jgi:hypothetical protein
LCITNKQELNHKANFSEQQFIRKGKNVMGDFTMDLKIVDLMNGNDEDLVKEKWKLFKIRFDYAWRSFEFHAKQRISMFNFFILFSGILAAAYGTLLRAKEPFIASVALIIGSVVCIIFLFLDRRNEELVHISEDILCALEKDIIFTEFKRKINWPKRRDILGYMQTGMSTNPKQLGIHFREEEDNNLLDKESMYQHGTWIPRLQVFLAIIFFGGAILTLV